MNTCQESTVHLSTCAFNNLPYVRPSLDNSHLVSCLARLTKKTWRESDMYEVIEEVLREGHGHHYMYVFTQTSGVSVKKISIMHGDH